MSLGIKSMSKANDFTSKSEILMINYLTAGFILLLLFSWCDHFFRFLNSVVRNGKVTRPTECLVAGTLLFVLLVFLIRKRVHICKINFQFIDIFVLSLGTMYYILKLPFFDNGFDDLCYAFILQSRPFVDNSSSLFFMDKSYMYCLGDRVFYYFRMLFGCRFSTIVNYIIFVVAYYQIKEILNIFSDAFDLKLQNISRKISVKGSVIPVLSVMVLLCEFFVAGMYLVKPDIFIVPILLECIRIIFCKRKVDNSDFFYLSLLFGFAVAIKLTFVLSLVPILLIGLFIHRKDVKLSSIVALVSPFACIVSIYIIYSWLAVDNPVYPYYNWIFKGAYAPTSTYSWDTRWGPKTLCEKLLWPIINFINPQYRYCELGWCSGRLAYGYLLSVISLVVGAFSHRLRCIIPMAFMLIASIYIWSITAGYARYAIGIEIFAGIFIVILIFKFIQLFIIHKNKSYKVIAILLTVLFVFQFCYAQAIVTYVNLDWKGNSQSIFVYDVASRRNAFFNEYISNFKKIFTDRGHPTGENSEEVERELENVKVWVDAGNSMYATLLNPDVPIYYINTVFTEELMAKATSNLFANYSTEGMYGLSLSALNNEILTFHESGLYVEYYFEFETDFLAPGEKITLYKLNTMNNICNAGICENIVNPMKNNQISLDENREKQLFDFYSWGLSGQESGGIWTQNTEVLLPLYLSDISKDSVLYLTASSFGSQTVEISINDGVQNTYNFDGSIKIIEIPISKEIVNENGLIIIKMKIPTATKSPLDLGQSNDNRPLGLCLREIEIK